MLWLRDIFHLTHWPLNLIRAVLPIMLISHIPMVLRQISVPVSLKLFLVDIVIWGGSDKMSMIFCFLFFFLPWFLHRIFANTITILIPNLFSCDQITSMQDRKQAFYLPNLMIPNIPISKYLLFNPGFRMNNIPIHKKWFSIQLGRSKKLFHSVMAEEENITQQIIPYEYIQKLMMIWNIFHTILEFFLSFHRALNFEFQNFEFHWLLCKKVSEIQNFHCILNFTEFWH